jgi:hypothetical protein
MRFDGKEFKEFTMAAAKLNYSLVFIQGNSISNEKQNTKYEEFGSIRKIIHAGNLIVSLGMANK